ncbi:thiaminase II [Alkalicoccus urumqiensis]|uniref:Aminopyrimidine aminohydrolase n=1 Tax=Alkalicoccus urumqiensis TaxID=1548213 RepID=A0A2P6MJD2_ALKUR|nr:thiaminase II [Alkalicoccus urumqiensis]PRO66381.1 thiaminase II [Alkalicoccus urumqiensis]
MRFSEELRQEAEPVFEAIFHHPFVKGIGEGDLPKEALLHYVRQDFEYLTTFCRIYGLAVSKCTDRQDMTFFQEQIGFILNDEVHPHHNFCEVAGVRYEELQKAPLAPTAHHYTRHMMEAAQGSLGETLTALAPCPWTYWEIGCRLAEEVNPDKTHPFYDWIMFYAADEVDSITTTFRSMIDRCAEQAGAEEKKRMKSHFLLSAQMEYAFWEMAYKQEGWPVRT